MTNFEKEFGSRKIGFLIRKFEEREDRNRLLATIRDTFRQKGFSIVDANEKSLHPETWGNIKEFLNNCSFGVVLIDDLSETVTGFNPNVFLEIGYLLALKKDILILIQRRLAANLPTDIKPFIYIGFDSLDIESQKLKNEITKWIDNTIGYNPGYITAYIRGEIISIDLISEFKNIAFGISNCSIIENGRLTSPDQEEMTKLCINCDIGVRKIDFKTQTKDMADRFSSDFENGHYLNVPLVKESILRIVSNSISIGQKYSNGGITYLFNNDKEALIYCQNVGIQGCEEEERYANNLFKIKKTRKTSEIEIVVMPKFRERNTFLYISNYYHQESRHCVKMCHYPKDSSRIVLPFNAVDVLFLVI